MELKTKLTLAAMLTIIICFVGYKFNFWPFHFVAVIMLIGCWKMHKKDGGES